MAHLSLLEQPVVVAVGVLWLLVGLPLWLLELAGGGEFIPTSLLTHVLGLVVGLVGVWRLGMPEGAWWKATLALLVLNQLCRWVTPVKANVNVAFAIHPGWDRWFSSHLAYILTLTLLLGFAGTWRALGAKPAAYLRNE